jgi:histidinol-phosphate aminotransferase
MTYLYEKAATSPAGLRLHLNENTSGCSPAVMRALRALTPEMVAFYPDYSAPIAAVARHLGVAESCVALTNGLDEGILAACMAAVLPGDQGAGEAIVIVPAFDMQGACARSIGARVREVPLENDFTFPAARVLDAIRPETRIVFITTPNNPTGMAVPAQEVAMVASAAPHALIFVDEAYADFSSTTLMDSAIAREHPNIVVGRTFSKAYGLAGLRCGALIGAPAVIAQMQRVLPPYSINVAAAVALAAALEDRAHYDWYLSQVRQSRALLYEAFDRLRVEHWQSQANFVLARFGSPAAQVCALLAERGIHVRDRSKQPLCGGCVRITAGVAAHTIRCIAAIEEVLCVTR